jgi:RNA polymerase sigma-70 factor, ECF subfamily
VASARRGAEHRLAEFAELATAALANVNAREQLAASRARIVEAGYQERRRPGRDLHEAPSRSWYRMLASVHDAEDAMQDVMLRAWRALAKYEARAPLRSWLYKIATNVCLDAIEKRPKRVVPLDRASTANRHDEAAIQPSPRHVQNGQAAGAHDGAAGIETAYEHREAAALAFSLALHLPAKQRAVLILRDVLGFSARETASSLETTITAVNSALQRARANLDDGLDPDRPGSPSALGDRRFQDAVERFMDALKRGDIDALVGIVADTTLSNKRSRRFTPLPS